MTLIYTTTVFYCLINIFFLFWHWQVNYKVCFTYTKIF